MTSNDREVRLTPVKIRHRRLTSAKSRDRLPSGFAKILLMSSGMSRRLGLWICSQIPSTSLSTVEGWSLAGPSPIRLCLGKLRCSAPNCLVPGGEGVLGGVMSAPPIRSPPMVLLRAPTSLAVASSFAAESVSGLFKLR
jgi:hypothetical protein